MDYIATYDPSTNKITKWAHPEFNNGLGLTLFGMDVVTSSTNPKELYLYLINHRVPISGQRPETIGSDPHIEIFKMSDAGEILGHIRSVRDPKVIITPADIVGSPDGKSFYFTNDHAKRVGWVRHFPFYTNRIVSDQDPIRPALLTSLEQSRVRLATAMLTLAANSL